MTAAGPPQEPAQAKAALARVVQALRGFGALQPVQAALTPDAHIERHGWDAKRGRIMETFDGHAQIAAWCGRSPRNVLFTLDSPPQAEGPLWRCRYRVAVGDYENHGTWRSRLADDGRVAWLSHEPDDLPDEWRTGVPEGKSLGPPPPPRPGHAGAEHAATGQAHAHDHSRQDPQTAFASALTGAPAAAPLTEGD